MPSGQSPRSNSIIVGNCTACEGLVRVSAKAKANSNVRCPHCQEIFPLLRLLESAVPEVEVLQTNSPSTPTHTPATTTTREKRDLYIDQTAELGKKDAAGKFVVPSQLAKGARRRKSSRRSRGGSSSSSSNRSSSDSSSRESRQTGVYQGDDERDRAREATVQTRPVDNHRNGVVAEPHLHPHESRDHSENLNRVEGESHRSTRHRDMRAIQAMNSEPNPVVTFLKVLAGGALALPIAYLIVMWVFNQDPLGIGPQLGEKIPFVVPSALRGEAAETQDSDSDSSSDGLFRLDEDSDPLSPNVIDSGFKQFDIGQEALEGLDR